MTFAQWRNRVPTHFSERIPIVKWRMTVLSCDVMSYVDGYQCHREIFSSIFKLPSSVKTEMECCSKTLVPTIKTAWRCIPDLHVYDSRMFSVRVLPDKLVHSCQQKCIGLKFSKSQTGSDVRYSCHHNSSRFTFPIFAHSCRFSVLHWLQSITLREVWGELAS
jgi:hypothetical protein